MQAEEACAFIPGVTDKEQLKGRVFTGMLTGKHVVDIIPCLGVGLFNGTAADESFLDSEFAAYGVITEE